MISIRLDNQTYSFYLPDLKFQVLKFVESFKIIHNIVKTRKKMIIERIKLYFFKRKFRKLNLHNMMYANNEFDPSIVKIGKMSYGGLTIDMFHAPGEELRIGNYVSIANGVKFILGGNHHTNALSTFPFKGKVLGIGGETTTKGPIIIEDDVWIGSYSVLLSGIKVGKGAVIAAGSVVVNDVASYSIVGGNPAKFIKFRIDEKFIDDVKEMDLSLITHNYVKNNIELLYSPLNEQTIEELKKSFH